MTRSGPDWLGPRHETGGDNDQAMRMPGRDYRADDAAFAAAMAAAAAPARSDYIGNSRQYASQLKSVLERACNDRDAFPVGGGTARRLLLVVAMDSAAAVLVALDELAQLEPDVEQGSDMDGPRTAGTAGVLNTNINTEVEQRR